MTMQHFAGIWETEDRLSNIHIEVSIRNQDVCVKAYNKHSKKQYLVFDCIVTSESISYDVLMSDSETKVHQRLHSVKNDCLDTDITFFSHLVRAKPILGKGDLVGSWKNQDDDEREIIDIYREDGKICVRASDKIDFEVYEVKELRYEGSILHFAVYAPSTGYHSRRTLILKSKHLIKESSTIFEKWRRVDQVSG